MLKTKTEIAAFFKLTVNQLYSELDRVISTAKYIARNYYGESVERQCYYMDDYDESFVYYADVQDGYKYKKAPYSLDGDNVTINFAESKRIKYSPTDWEDGSSDEDDMNAMQTYAAYIENEASELFTKIKNESDQKIEDFSVKIAEKDESIIELGKNIQEFEEKFSAAEATIASKDDEIEILTSEVAKYKQTEDEEKVEGLFVEYSALITDEEKKDLVSKRAQFTTFSDFEKEVKSFVCDRIVKKAKDHKMNFISMGLPIDDEDNQENKKPKSLWDRLGQ